MKLMSLYCARVNKTRSSNGFYIGAIVNFLNRKYIYFLEYIYDNVPNLEEFSVEPERQYFPLVGFALRGRGVGRFCLNAKSFKFDAFSHFRSGL